MADESSIDIVIRAQDLASATFDQIKASAASIGDSAKTSVDPVRAIGDAIASAGTSSGEAGQKVSGLGKLLEELKPSTDNAHAAFTDLKGTLSEMWENPTHAVSQLAGALGGDLSAGLGAAGAAAGLMAGAMAVVGVAIFELAEKAAGIGGHLQDMHEKTGIAVEDLSRLAYAAPIAGTSIDALSNVVFMMQKNMAESPDKFEKGLERIGLNFEQFKQLKPDEQLLALSSALKETEDPVERNAAGFEMMGRQFRDAAPALYKLNDALALTKDLNPWSNEEAEQAEHMEMMLASIHVHLDNIGTTLGREVLPGVDRFVTALDSMAHWTPGEWLQKLLTYGFGPVGYINAKANEITAGYVGAATAMVAPEGVAGYGGLNLPGVKDPYSQEVGASDKEIEQILSGKLKPATQQGIVGSTNEETFKLIEGYLKEQAAAAAAAAKMWAEYNSVGQGVYDTLMKMDGAVVEAIAYDLKRGESVSILTQVYGVHAEQIKAVQAEEKFWASVTDETTKSLHGMSIVIPDLTERTALLREQLEMLDSTKNQVSGGRTIAGDLLDHTNIPMFGTLPNVQPSGSVPATLIQADSDAHKLKLSLDNIDLAFQRIGVSSSSGLGQGIGAMLSMVRVIEQADAAFSKVEDKFGVGSPQATEAGGARTNAIVAQAVSLGAGYIAQTIDTGAGAGTGSLVAHGALEGLSTGVMIGSAIPGIGTVIGGGVGAGVGALVGWIQSGEEWRKVVNDISRDMGGIKVSEDFAKMIDKLESDTGLQRTQALTTQLDQLMQMAGGLNAEFGDNSNFDLFFGKLHDAFSYIEQGSMTVAQVTQVMDKNFATFAAAGTDAYGRISDKIRELIDLNQRFGTDSTAITTWMSGQATTAASGLTDLLMEPMMVSADAIGKRLTDAKKAVDDAQAAIDANEAKGQSSSGSGTANQRDAVTKASQDLAYAKAKEAQQDTIAHYKAVEAAQQRLDKAQDATGGSGASSKDATLHAALTKAQDELNAALTEQHDAAERNKQAMNDLGAVAMITFDAATASGESFAQALKAISPQLATIQHAFKDLGLTIEDDALRGLAIENTILNGTKDAPSHLGTAISGLQAGTTASMNLGKGVETADAFATQERVLNSLFEQTQGAADAAAKAMNGPDAHGETRDALLPFQGLFHELEDWSKKNGVALDHNTQEHIDQSKELGIWTDEQKSDGELTRMSITELIASNEKLAAALSGTPYTPPVTPGANHSTTGDPWAPKSGTATTTTPPTGAAGTPGWREGDTDPNAPPVFPMADGGYGFASGPMAFTTKGNEEYAFSGEGRKFARASASASPAASSGDTHYHYYTINAVEASSFRMLIERNPEILAKAVNKAYHGNKGRAKTELTGILGLT